MMFWLISYRFEACFKRTDGSISRNEAMDAVEVFDASPAAFLMAAREKFLALQDAAYNPDKGPQRADDITRIYSATQISEEEYRALIKIL